MLFKSYLVCLLVLFLTFVHMDVALAVQPVADANVDTQSAAFEAFYGDEFTRIPRALKPDYSCLTLGEMIAMIAGAVIGGATADFIVNSAPFAVVGIAAGAAIGSILYQHDF
ncbi:hypothetical protein TI04_09525 [Achromatium sp. WMS2]|nr:hypothetical protein TI04_09525 [Achromatium sp. WMS2]